MTRTALGTPEEPDDPFDQFEAEFEDIEHSDTAEAETRPARVDLCDFVTVWRSDLVSRCPVEELRDSAELRAPTRTTYTYDLRFERHVLERPQVKITEPRKAARYARVWPQQLTGLAVLIAGRKRAVVGSEWRAHLSGETGAGLSADRQVHEAAGFVLAAIRYRVQDAADLAWRPMDAVLGSRALSSFFVLLATLSFSLWLMRKIGVYGLAECLESVGVVFGTALGTIHVGRWWRGVKPPEHKPRRPKELPPLTLTRSRVTSLTWPPADVR